MPKSAARTASGVPLPDAPIRKDNQTDVRTKTSSQTVKTHCCYCAVQCGMTLTDGAKEVEVAPQEHPINRGKLCVLGQNSVKLFDHAERLTTPLVRRGGELVPAPWDEALERVVAGFKFLQFKYGHAANAVYSGASVSTEKAYLLGKFARVALHTPHIDYNGRYCMAAAASGALKAFGLDRGLNMPMADIPEHDAILIIGSNTAETLPILVNTLLEARDRGAKFIVVDPRKTTTANLAALHLPVDLGGDLALANALLRVVLDNAWQDETFISARTNGFEKVAEYLQSIPLEHLIQMSGLEEPQVFEAAKLLSEAKNPLILTGRGADQNSRGVETTLAFINLSLALGANYGTLTGQANGQGGREHGMKADQLPGYRSIADDAAREHVASVWGVDADSLPGPGYSAFELMQAVGRKEVRGLFVLGSNPVVSSPDTDRVRAWVKEMDHLVVVDSFLSETASLADVVLPGSLWAEETGTTTNLEGRVVLREALREPPKGARRDLDIIVEVAQRLGHTRQFLSAQPEDIFEELRRASKGGPADYYGVTYERLREGDGLFWPCPDLSHPGTPNVFTERFAHADGRAAFHVIPYRQPNEIPDGDYPFQLTTGRTLVHYLTGNHTRRTPLLASKRPEPWVEVSPVTAAQLKLIQGEYARLSTRRAAALFKVKISKKIKPGVLFIPMHWEGAQAANRLTNPVLDPHCKMPEFKVCAARLEPVPQTDLTHTDTDSILNLTASD